MSEESDDSNSVDDSAGDEALKTLQGLAVSIGEFLQASMPGFPEEKIIQLAMLVAGEQLEVIDKEVSPSFSGEPLQTHPLIAVTLDRVVKVPGVEEPSATVFAEKRVSSKSKLADALVHAFVVAFLNAPHIRAYLRANGFKYSFMQSPRAEEKPKIQLQ